MQSHMTIPNELYGKHEIVDEFHRQFYSRGAIEIGPNGIKMPTEANYLGVHVQKNPLDLWIFQEILSETKPDLIIECGTGSGGSALFMAHILDQIGNGKIISIDLADRSEILPKHSRIEYFTGVNDLDYYNSSGRIYKSEYEKIMVILDSDHTGEHVYRQLLVYSRFVTPGQYLIVEDTNINGHPVGVKRDDGGPYEAVQRFLGTTSDFVIDKRREKFLLTFNPDGYLKRVR